MVGHKWDATAEIDMPIKSWNKSGQFPQDLHSTTSCFRMYRLILSLDSMNQHPDSISWLYWFFVSNMSLLLSHNCLHTNPSRSATVNLDLNRAWVLWIASSLTVYRAWIVRKPMVLITFWEVIGIKRWYVSRISCIWIKWDAVHLEIFRGSRRESASCTYLVLHQDRKICQMITVSHAINRVM